MAVRNCYLSAKADGRDSRVTAGPASKDGGMSAVFTVRSHGAIIPDCEVWYGVSPDGKTIIRHILEDGIEISRREFTR